MNFIDIKLDDCVSKSKNPCNEWYDYGYLNSQGTVMWTDTFSSSQTSTSLIFNKIGKYYISTLNEEINKGNVKENNGRIC